MYFIVVVFVCFCRSLTLPSKNVEIIRILPGKTLWILSLTRLSKLILLNDAIITTSLLFWNFLNCFVHSIKCKSHFVLMICWKQWVFQKSPLRLRCFLARFSPFKVVLPCLVWYIPNQLRCASYANRTLENINPLQNH